MRSLFALGLMVLALNFPLCAQLSPQDVGKTGAVAAASAVVHPEPTTKSTDTQSSSAEAVSSGLVVSLPPLLFSSEAITTKPNHQKISSGLVVAVPDFLPVATRTMPSVNTVSSGIVVKVPDFLPETHK